jgi:hypothetical protein
MIEHQTEQPPSPSPATILMDIDSKILTMANLIHLICTRNISHPEPFENLTIQLREMLHEHKPTGKWELLVQIIGLEALLEGRNRLMR